MFKLTAKLLYSVGGLGTLACAVALPIVFLNRKYQYLFGKIINIVENTAEEDRCKLLEQSCNVKFFDLSKVVLIDKITKDSFSDISSKTNLKQNDHVLIDLKDKQKVYTDQFTFINNKKKFTVKFTSFEAFDDYLLDEIKKTIKNTVKVETKTNNTGNNTYFIVRFFNDDEEGYQKNVLLKSIEEQKTNALYQWDWFLSGQTTQPVAEIYEIENQASLNQAFNDLHKLIDDNFRTKNREELTKLINENLPQFTNEELSKLENEKNLVQKTDYLLANINKWFKIVLENIASPTELLNSIKTFDLKKDNKTIFRHHIAQNFCFKKINSTTLKPCSID